MISPRTLKTQLPYHSMPGRNPAGSPAKYIYVYRNPKDAAVSMFYHVKSLHSKANIQWSNFFESYCVQGKVPYGHVVDHVVEWWKYRGKANCLVLNSCIIGHSMFVVDAPNIHFENYEDMKRDTSLVIKRVSHFLGYDLNDEIVSKISDQVQFESMKKNDGANLSWMKNYHESDEATPFLRKGMVGDWRNHFTDEQSKKMDEIITTKTKDAVGLVYDHGGSA